MTNPLPNNTDDLDKILGDLVWVAQMSAHRIENNIGDKNKNIERAKTEIAEAKQKIKQLLVDERIDEIDTAIKMTRQTWDKKSPFANVENINANILGATSQYLLTRQASLKELKENSGVSEK